MQFQYASEFPYRVDQLFDYHQQAGAISRLIPPWESASVLSSDDSLKIGSIVKVSNQLGPIPLTWVAEHTELAGNQLFVDELRSGPFARWKHLHLFETVNLTSSKLSECIEYQLHAAPMSNFLKPWVEEKLRAMFRFRHQITRDDLKLSNQLAQLGHTPASKRIKIGISGSSGLVGRRTVELARVLGIDIIRSIRPHSSEKPTRWPRGVESVQEDQLEAFEGLDAWIHLGGVGIAEKRWSDGYKKAIRQSRVESTKKLVERLHKLDQPPKAFVCASGVGIFGDRGDEILDESSPVSTIATKEDFLSNVAQEWESAALGFEKNSHRAVLARFGVVLHPRAGALSKMLLPFWMGFGGPMGNGNQFWPWIHIDDAASILLFLALNDRCQGPFNVVAPECMSNRDFSRVLAKVLRRPSWLAAPKFALRIALGEMADSLLLSSTRTVPAALSRVGYEFRFPTLDGALRNLLGKPT